MIHSSWCSHNELIVEINFILNFHDYCGYREIILFNNILIFKKLSSWRVLTPKTPSLANIEKSSDDIIMIL